MTLDSIIERLEKAEPGDRHLEVDIWRFFNPDADPRRIPLPWVACYTESADAVIALSEKAMPGWCWLVRNDEEAGAFANVTKRNGNYEDGVDAFPVWAKTPALALVTSLLKAKQMGVGE